MKEQKLFLNDNCRMFSEVDYNKKVYIRNLNIIRKLCSSNKLKREAN